MVIETKRLFLCPLENKHISTVENLWKNKKVRKYLGGICSSEVIKKKIADQQRHWKLYEFGQWTVIEKISKEVLGLCGFNISEDGCELSYMFFPQFWGKGFAYEAANASIAYGFNTIKAKEIVSITQVANIRSCHLLSKIGMKHVKNFERFNDMQSLFKIKSQPDDISMGKKATY